MHIIVTYVVISNCHHLPSWFLNHVWFYWCFLVQETYRSKERQAVGVPVVSDGRVHQQPHGDGETAQDGAEEETGWGDEKEEEGNCVYFLFPSSWKKYRCYNCSPLHRFLGHMLLVTFTLRHFLLLYGQRMKSRDWWLVLFCPSLKVYPSIFSMVSFSWVHFCFPKLCFWSCLANRC